MQTVAWSQGSGVRYRIGVTQIRERHAFAHTERLRTGMVDSATKLSGKSAALVAVALLGSGCASVSEKPDFSLPAMPSLASVSAIGAGSSEKTAGTPTELYGRIGRGAMACWFGANGPLKLGYIYHAEAEPASRGGKAEIIIHARELGQPNPRGPKAFLVNISPVGETASVQSENLKMPEAMGRAMTADVERWSRGETACSSSAVAGTWSPQSPDAKGAVSKASSKAPGVKKIKSKVAAQKPATP